MAASRIAAGSEDLPRPDQCQADRMKARLAIGTTVSVLLGRMHEWTHARDEIRRHDIEAAEPSVQLVSARCGRVRAEVQQLH